MRKFGREVSVTIAKPKGFFGDGTNAITISTLAVAFKIEKVLGKDPNTCEIEIRNMSKATRAEVQATPRIVRLDAGYDGELERIFTGDLIWAQSKLENVDWITKLQVSDGARAIAQARVNRSFKRGTSVRVVVEEVARQLGLTLPRSALAQPAMSKQFAAGVSLHGLASREMSRVLDHFGLVWSIQDGRLQILSELEARPDRAIVISQEHGMVGVPEFGTPPKKGKPPVLSGKTLLEPGIRPGGLLSLDTATVRGVFKTQKVSHAGDTHGADWTTSWEATAVAA